MTECAGFGGQTVRGKIPSPCVYDALWTVKIDGKAFDVCTWHERVFTGDITDAGTDGWGRPRALSWTPRSRKEPKALERTPRDALLSLLREWA